MGFTTFEERNNPYVTPHVEIHRDGCMQIARLGALQNWRLGEYKNHKTYAEARAYAETKSLPIKDCYYCKARG